MILVGYRVKSQRGVRFRQFIKWHAESIPILPRPLYRPLISDDAAIIFASRFYSAIGFSLFLQRAFDQAHASLLFDNAEEVDTPMLFTADGINPTEVYFVKSKLENIMI